MTQPVIRASVLALCLCASPIALALSPVNASVSTERDRASILAMQGEYIVDFAFD